MTDQAHIALFAELIRLWGIREESARVQLQEHLPLWCSERISSMIDSPELRSELAEGIRKLVRSEFCVYLHSLMAAFDGATQLSDDGRVVSIVDDRGHSIGGDLKSKIMDYLVDIDWQ